MLSLDIALDFECDSSFFAHIRCLILHGSPNDIHYFYTYIFAFEVLDINFEIEISQK